MKLSFSVGALFFASALAVLAEDIGVDFNQMPKGCRWYTDYSSGEHRLSEFIGRKRSKYIVETRDVGPGNGLVARTEFDAQGRMVARIWQDGASETFSPFSCYDVPGDCSYSYRQSDGTSVMIESRVERKGKSFTNKSSARGGAPYPDETFQKGPYGLLKFTKSANYWTKIVRFEGCALPTS